MPVLLALSAALSWGTSDFLGGVAARRGGRVNAVTLGTQLTGLLASVPIGILIGGSLQRADFWWALVAGMSSGLAIYLLYTGFTKSHTGVVAPIAAIGTAAIPALFGLATGETLSAPQSAGVLLGLAAIWLVSRPNRVAPRRFDSGRFDSSQFDSGQFDSGAGVVYGVGAGLAFAFMFIALDQLSAASGGWGVMPLRLGGVLLVFGISALGRLPMIPMRRAWLLVFAAGFVGSFGNLAFIVATRLGDLAIVAVVASLFPAATVGLAYLFLHERLSRIQLLGVVAALTAVALVSGG